MTQPPRKKLIEVGMPLAAINAAAEHEKSVPRRGHPSTMHLYWAPRPLAVARAVLFAQLVDDPSSHPDRWPTLEEQDNQRARLHRLIEELVVWENSNNEDVLRRCRAAIQDSVGDRPLRLLDPFAGGGAIPLEAQRLGLLPIASDLNPVAVLRTKGLVEIPPRFSGQPPVHPTAGTRATPWERAEGLAEDVRQYGAWVRDEARRRIGSHYPKVIAPGGTEHTVIGWIWARTVQSPNPANPIETPLVRSWSLSTKKGKEAYVVPSVVDGSVQYRVERGIHGAEEAKGTVQRGRAQALGDGTPITNEYIREEARAGRMGAHLLAVVAQGEKGRIYIAPDAAQVAASRVDVNQIVDPPTAPIAQNPRWFSPPLYGLETYADVFTPRQLLALTTFSDLVTEVREQVLSDALAAGLPVGDRLEDGGRGATAYADAVATYLAFAVSKLADWSSSLCSWIPSIEGVTHTFSRQALPMVWDFVEINPFSQSVGHFYTHVDWVAHGVAAMPADGAHAGEVTQADAASRDYAGAIVSTDPPYYDNIGYSDLSDFFYIWLRRSLGTVHSKTLGTLLTPKDGELVANPYRRGGKLGAEEFFVAGFNDVFKHVREAATSDEVMTVYYAYKQQDKGKDGTSSTGWLTLLNGLIDSGWEITATWPLRSEREARMVGLGTNALASSIVLACRPRAHTAESSTRRSFVASLKSELPEALRRLMQADLAPVDLAQAAIGPGVAVFSRYSRVREADGSDMSVKDALLLVNATLDEVIGEQESDFDPDTRFAVKWYRQYGWAQENSGIAEQLARSSDTSVGALERGGILEAKGGRARLLSPTQLEDAWDVSGDDRVSVWEATVRLAAVMAKRGADQVAALLPLVQTRVSLDAVKELGFLLFHEAEKKRDTRDAILFNGLVSAWGDVNEQARKHAGSPRAVQQAFDFDEEEG